MSADQAIRIPSGFYVELPLEVERGILITGELEEEDGNEFHRLILNEENWKRYKEGKRFRCLPGQDRKRVPYDLLNWTPRSNAKYHLVLIASYGKRVSIMVDLKYWPRVGLWKRLRGKRSEAVPIRVRSSD